MLRAGGQTLLRHAVLCVGRCSPVARKKCFFHNSLMEWIGAQTQVQKGWGRLCLVHANAVLYEHVEQLKIVLCCGGAEHRTGVWQTQLGPVHPQQRGNDRVLVVYCILEWGTCVRVCVRVCKCVHLCFVKSLSTGLGKKNAPISVCLRMHTHRSTYP